MISTNTEAVIRTENLFPEFLYLEQLIRLRLQQHFADASGLQEPYFPDPELFSLQHLAHFVRKHNLSIPEIVVLLVAIVPHAFPELIDNVVESTLKGAGDFPKIGGVRGKNFRGFLPTGETIIFLLGEDQLENRF